VGVDVPNAALMVVENAARFGLSQLHQLRGRVGRGSHQSYCVLFEGAGGEASRERLRILCRTIDGFKIAEEDLRLRGPGDFFGSRQHGLPEMRVASFSVDMDLLKAAQEEAAAVLERDPELSEPENRALRERIAALFELKTAALN
jgi:ATP-dependent DNA helicase RecG